MSLDAFNYTKGALLYAFCYGVYVKQLCSPWTGERIKGSVSPKRLIVQISPWNLFRSIPER